MHVSFVVLNWKTKELTRQCVLSIQRIRIPKDVEIQIIIVENGSNDGSLEYLQSNFGSTPNLTIKANRENLGFSGGQDSVRSIISESDFVALINSDAILDDSWLEEVLNVAETSPKIAAVGGRAYDWDGSDSREKKGFYSYQIIDPHEGFAQTLRSGEHIQDVDGISGAALLIRIPPALAVGYFDPEFFCYYEETDLIARLKRAGFRCVYTPKAHAWHMIAASSSLDDSKYNDFYQYHMHRNRLFFAYKNFEKPYLRKLFLRYILRFLNNICSKTSPWKKIKNEFRVLGGFIKNLPRLHMQRSEVTREGVYNTSLSSISKPSDVTVVVPCFNYGVFLGEAIDSILNQTLPPVKVVLVNDGSTDNSLEVMRGYQEKHPTIIDVIDQSNGGVARARNRGFKEVGTFWTIFLDADDILDPTYIERTVSAAKEHSASIVYTDMLLFDTTQKKHHQKFRKYSKSALWQANFIHNSALIETQILREVGGYKEIMEKGLEDWELFISLGEKTKHFYYIPEPLLHYRQHSNFGRNDAAEIYLPALRKKVRMLHKKFFDSPYNNLQFVAKKLLFLPVAFVTIFISLGYLCLYIARHIINKTDNYTQRVLEKIGL
jgi:GT2 family glycosyltransferase